MTKRHLRGLFVAGWASVSVLGGAFHPPHARAQEGDSVAARLVPRPGFRVQLFTDGVEGVRFMALGPDSQVYATLTRRGEVVRIVDTNGDGRADQVEIISKGLDRPHGIAFHGGALWIAESGRVIKYPAFKPGKPLANPVVVVPDLPRGGMHFTRTIVFGPRDGMLYVAIGSSCNVCEEKDPRRAAIVRYNPDGSGEEVFAHGMRNAVGLAFRPGTEELWATCNERDWLGDDLPPEEIVNILVKGGDYGWPYCYGNRVPNPEFNDTRRCTNTTPPLVTDTAHSAPLGCAFYTGTQFPPDYRGDFFVCYHGSWNRSKPSGYKVARVRVRDGKPQPPETFLDGFRSNGGVLARPVFPLVAHDGSLLVSDDYGGRIFRVSYVGK